MNQDNVIKNDSEIFVVSNNKNIFKQSYQGGTMLIAHNNNQRTNGPVNAHLISWPSKAQNIQNLENDLDLQYLHTFIISISCLHLPTIRSQAAIVSEKSTVFTFSHMMGWSPDATYQVSWKSACRIRRRRFLKGLYNIWAWRPSWSCDQHHVIRFSFPCT